jgi:hypothetical protein
VHFAYTDPQHDIDTSKDFAGFSTLEQRLSHVAYHVLHAPCQQGAAADSSSSSSDGGSTAAQQHEEQAQAAEGLMLDVGAGFGWYSLMAGMLGCR